MVPKFHSVMVTTTGSKCWIQNSRHEQMLISTSGYFTQVPALTGPFREAKILIMIKYLLMNVLVFLLIKSMTTHKIGPYSKLTSCWTPKHHSPYMALMASQSPPALRCLQCMSVVLWNSGSCPGCKTSQVNRSDAQVSLDPYVRSAEKKVNADKPIGA